MSPARSPSPNVRKSVDTTVFTQIWQFREKNAKWLANADQRDSSCDRLVLYYCWQYVIRGRSVSEIKKEFASVERGFLNVIPLHL